MLLERELLEWIEPLCLGTGVMQGRGQLSTHCMAAEKGQLQRVQCLWAFVLEVLKDEPSPSVNISLYKALYYLPLHGVGSLIVLGKEEFEGGPWEKTPRNRSTPEDPPQLDSINSIKGMASLALATQNIWGCNLKDKVFALKSQLQTSTWTPWAGLQQDFANRVGRRDFEIKMQLQEEKNSDCRKRSGCREQKGLAFTYHNPAIHGGPGVYFIFMLVFKTEHFIFFFCLCYCLQYIQPLYSLINTSMKYSTVSCSFQH